MVRAAYGRNMPPMLTYPNEQSRSSSFLRSKFNRPVRPMPPKNNVYESGVKPFNRKPFFSVPKTSEFIQENIRRRPRPFPVKNNDFGSAQSLRGEPPSLLNKSNEFGRPFPRQPPPFLSVSNSPANLPRSGRPPPLFAGKNSAISYPRRPALPPFLSGNGERTSTSFQRHPPPFMEHSTLKRRMFSFPPRDNDKNGQFYPKRRPPPLLTFGASFSETTRVFSPFPEIPFSRGNQEAFNTPPSLLKRREPVKRNPKKIQLPATLKKKTKPVVESTVKKLKNKRSKKKKIKSYAQLKEKFLKRPWINEELKGEVEKQFELLKNATNNKEDEELWKAYAEQKKLVSEKSGILRQEYLKTQMKALPYYCESCDRGFINNDKYSEHVAQHVTCGKQGCTFTGHVKIVEKHSLMQHRTGLFDRIVKGNSPEEIEKWISERKRHFPTKQKIDEKKAQTEEMEKRGERYTEQKKTFNNRNSNYKGRQFPMNKNGGRTPYKSTLFGSKQNFKRNKFPSSTETEAPPKRKRPIRVYEEEEEVVIRNLPPFCGTTFFLNTNNTLDDNAGEKSNAEETVLNPESETVSKEIVSCDEDCLSNASEDSDRSSVICTNIIEKTEISLNTIDELEISEVTSELSEKKFSSSGYDSEEDCLDKHFKNCDSPVNEVEQTVKSCNTSESKENSSVSKNTSLDLLRCYDSDESENEVESQNKPEHVEVDSDDSGPTECSSKIDNIAAHTSESKEDSTLKQEEAELDNNESKKRKRRKRKDGNEMDEKNTTVKTALEEKRPPVFPTYKKYRPPTLLEKLLAQEIRHERNVILQCIRYVVRNDYFNVTNTNTSSTT